MHNYIVALTGKSASGKSSIEQVLEKKYNYKRVISTTTRPIRSNEVNDVDYHFITENEFQKLIDENKLIEYRYYDTIQDGESTRWHYGIEHSEIDLDKHSYVCVVDLVGLEDLKKEYGYKVIAIYIDVSEEDRHLRAVARDRNFEDAEFQRRVKDDDIKFKDVQYKVDTIIRNDNLDKCLNAIIQKIKHSEDIKTFYSQYASY